MSSELFGDLPEAAGPERREDWAGEARVSRPARDQVGWEMVDLDQLIGPDHSVRLVTGFVESLDLSELYAAIKARSHGPGRDAIDPALLLGLWLYATIDGVGSAREVARLCTRDLPYRWLCGGVGVNYHALNDFRSQNGPVLDRLLSDSVTALVADGLVTLEVVAHDSLKVRASAGSSSYRRAAGLEKLRTEMEARVKTLRAELDGAPDASARRKASARERAARARLDKVKRAQARMKTLEAARAKQRKKDRVDPKTGEDKSVRVSTTDPDARILALSAGERRPGWSFQISGDPDTLVALAVSVHDGVDAGQIRPAIEQIEKRYGQRPKTVLADCGFCDKKDISHAHQQGVKAVIPSNLEAKHGDAAYDTTYGNRMPGIEAWRERMVEPATKTLYKLRSRVECIYGQMRNRGLRQLRLRGREKVKCEVLIHLLAQNMVCGARLRLAKAA
jgi:transposase